MYPKIIGYIGVTIRDQVTYIIKGERELAINIKI